MIGVIHPDSGWILSVIAKKMVQANENEFILLTPKTVVNVFKDHNEEVTEEIGKMEGFYYIDVQNCWLPWLKSAFHRLKHVGMFTHLHADNMENFRPHWRTMDGIVHMCQKYRTLFEVQGWYGPEQMTVIRPGEVWHIPLKKIRIGIAQRGEHVGKGSEFLPEVVRLLSQEAKDSIEFHFIGKGWIEGRSADYHGVQSVGYKEDSTSYPVFYSRIDCLLVPSLWEGGSMAVLEALAAGLPVIASDVGWCGEFHREVVKEADSFLYSPGDVDALVDILREIVDQKICRRRTVEHMSYRKYGDAVLRFFEEIVL